jgi:hypothetical protein
MTMKNKDYYLKKYREQKVVLEETNELWRLCHDSEDIFLTKLNEIFDRYEAGHFLNDFHKESSTKTSLELLLQKNMSKEEMIEQTKKLKASAKESFKKEAPKIKEYASKMKNPLSISDLSHIYRWIFREQISLDDLQNTVKKEFKNSKQYQSLVDRGVVCQ